MIRLVELKDADFEWLLGRSDPRYAELTLAPGGIDSPTVLGVIRRLVQQLERDHCVGAWMVAAKNEVVGLCSYKGPPAHGRCEIGYGIAASRRDRGYASDAVAAVVEIALQDPRIRLLTAETSIDNRPSERVLEKNGFVRINVRDDAKDGLVTMWEAPLDGM